MQYPQSEVCKVCLLYFSRWRRPELGQVEAGWGDQEGGCVPESRERGEACLRCCDPETRTCSGELQDTAKQTWFYFASVKKLMAFSGMGRRR